MDTPFRGSLCTRLQTPKEGAGWQVPGTPQSPASPRASLEGTKPLREPGRAPPLVPAPPLPAAAAEASLENSLRLSLRGRPLPCVPVLAQSPERPSAVGPAVPHLTGEGAGPRRDPQRGATGHSLEPGTPARPHRPPVQAALRIPSSISARVVLAGYALNRTENYGNEAVNVLSRCLCWEHQAVVSRPLGCPLPGITGPQGHCVLMQASSGLPRRAGPVPGATWEGAQHHPQACTWPGHPPLCVSFSQLSPSGYSTGVGPWALRTLIRGHSERYYFPGLPRFY